METFKIGDRVRQKYTLAERTGTIIGIWEEDNYFTDKEGKRILFACKGEYQVRFDNEIGNGVITFSGKELEKL